MMIENPTPEAAELMQMFARLEHGLRRNGYARRDRQVALIDWARFASELGEPFFAAARDSGNAAVLIRVPPRVYHRDKGLLPEQPPPIANVGELFVRGVCQVRNNIAHGEKLVELATQRDHDLVRDALWVLTQAIDRHPKARELLAKAMTG